MTDQKAAPNPGEFWDKMFSGEEYRYGRNPNAFLAKALPGLLPSGARVLSVGDGEGRNGVWCAAQGFQTTSIEPSRVGGEKIRALAREKGVHVEVITDLMPSDQIADESFDALVLTFIHAQPPTRRAIHRACIAALKPGGYIILEGFTPDQRLNERTSGGPGDIAMLFTEEILRDDFSSLQIERLETRVVELDEGPGHRGPADVVRLLARKK